MGKERGRGRRTPRKGFSTGTASIVYNNIMNKKNAILFATAVTVVSTMCIPFFASAQAVPAPTSTLGELQAQVAALLSQLASLQIQIREIKASSTPPGGGGNASGTWQGWQGAPTSTCMGFTRNLSLGSQGSDVSDLQSMLAQDPSVYPSGAITGYFGPLTEKAVTLFQEKNNIASSSTGFVGPLTRNFLMSHCGGPGPVRLPGGWISSSTNGSGTPPWMPPHPPQPAAAGTNQYQY